MNNDVVTLPPSVTVTPSGLLFRDGITFDEWQDVGRKLKAARSMIHWMIGDWLNYGETRWGEMYTQAEEDTEYAYKTLANDKYIARVFPASRRRELSWSHHEAVASMDVAAQDKLLDVAEKLKLTRDEFRREIAKYKENLELSTNLFQRLGSYPECFQWEPEKVSRYEAWIEQGKEFFE